MTTSITAARQLAERADKLERKASRDRLNGKIMAEKLMGTATVIVAAPLMGYLDGRFDAKDGVTGDGSKMFGMPVVPVLSAGVAVAGTFLNGALGIVVTHVGLAGVAGSFYSSAQKKGLEAAAKAAEKAGDTGE